MNKLYRSNTDKKISGVFGGLGEYFNIDSNLLRLFALILLFSNAFLASFFYLIAAIIIPVKDDSFYYEADFDKENTKNTSLFLGVSLIIIGIVLTFKKIFPNTSFTLLPNIKKILLNLMSYWPILLILLGIYVLANDNKE